MYTVYGMARNRTLRVLWMLEELNAAYDFVAAQPRSQEVYARNPSGKVPVLEVNGEALTDSVAICQFLADRHVALTFPAGSVARARQDGLTQFCVDEIEGALWTMAKHKFVLPEEHRVADIRPACEFEFNKAMRSLEARLGSGPYVMGEDFTVPDLLLGHCAVWAATAKLGPPVGRVADYFKRITSRPALARVREQFPA